MKIEKESLISEIKIGDLYYKRSELIEYGVKTINWQVY